MVAQATFSSRDRRSLRGRNSLLDSLSHGSNPCGSANNFWGHVEAAPLMFPVFRSGLNPSQTQSSMLLDPKAPAQHRRYYF